MSKKRTLPILGALICGLFQLQTAPAYAAEGEIFTIAGNLFAEGYSGDGGPATDATLDRPFDVAVDEEGNVFFVDTGNHAIRMVDTSGTISTVAGDGIRGNFGDGGPATSTRLSQPFGLTLDGEGNLYFAQHGYSLVGKLDAAGNISKVAGNGSAGFSGDGGPATSAGLNHPSDVAMDSAGNLFIADQRNHRVRKVDANGIISTVAGNGIPVFAGDGGAATDASLHFPVGVEVDSMDNLYIADTYNNRIRKVDTSGTISTVAGNGIAGYSGDGGAATTASLSKPTRVALDEANNLYIADYANGPVRKVDTIGTISTVAGVPFTSVDPEDFEDLLADGIPATSALVAAGGVAVDEAGNLFIAEIFLSRIRVVHAGSPNGVATANDDTVSTSEDTSLTLAAPGVLANDTDPDGDVITPTVIIAPVNGSATLYIDGSLLYTPDTDFNGTDSFTYVVNDGTEDSTPATVTITVTPVNDAPVAFDDGYSTNEDTPLTVAAAGVLGNDSDPVEMDPIIAVLVSGPGHGTVNLNADGAFSYTPNANFSGLDSFSYKANDGQSDSNEAVVTITVVSAADQIDTLIAKVEELVIQSVLSSGHGTALTAKLYNARKHLAKGKADKASQSIATFRTQVYVFAGNSTLTNAQAQPLLDCADEINVSLNQ